MSWGWTEDQSRTAERMWLDGHSASEIAKVVKGKTRNAVIGRLHRLGLMKTKRMTVYSSIATRGPDRKPRQTRSIRPKAPMFKIRPVSKLALIESPNARPWQERGPGQCKWPLGERHRIQSCCNPADEGSGYCAEHRAIGVDGRAVSAKELIRSVRRAA